MIVRLLYRAYSSWRRLEANAGRDYARTCGDWRPAWLWAEELIWATKGLVHTGGLLPCFPGLVAASKSRTNSAEDNAHIHDFMLIDVDRTAVF